MNDTTELIESRGEKRSMPPPTNEAVKRRAPYTLRACDACRKRKGRCNGESPCDYCTGRQTGKCTYTYPGIDRRAPDGKTIQSIDQSSITALSELVVSMQGQLASLTAKVQASTSDTKAQSPESSDRIVGANELPKTRSNSLTQVPDQLYNSPTSAPGKAVMTHDIDPPIANASKQTAKRYYGPTSPDFSWNVAESKTARSKHSPQAQRNRLPSLGEDHSDDEDVPSSEHISTPGSVPQANLSLSSLLHFSNLLPEGDAFRLINVYRGGLHELHPIYPIDRLLRDLDSVYKWRSYTSHAPAPTEALPDDVGLLLLNVVLCIALCAEASQLAQHGKAIFTTCESLINARLVGVATGVRHVILALLVSIYHLSTGRYPLASRLCAIAGRLAFELGIHNLAVLQQYPDEDQGQLATISCSLIVLDRQLNAAGGLPPNFQYTEFESAGKAVESPYLKAMMDFTLMSHTFNEPIDKAAKGETADDEETIFDITNFKVERWREKTLKEFDFAHPDQWSLTPSVRPPAWATMLYLRANAVKAILLRPLFLDQEPTTTKKQHLDRALNLVTESIHILSILDETTDIYRLLHSPFEHCLSAISALFFLVVVYIEHNQEQASSALPDDFAAIVRGNFWKALRLAAAYAALFASSRRLWRRLVTMRETLTSLGIITPSNPVVAAAQTVPADHHAEDPGPHAIQNQHYPASHTKGLEIVDWNQAATQMMMYPTSMTAVNDLTAFDMYYNTTNDIANGDMGLDFFTMDDYTTYQAFRYP